ncbi:hypothetical protein BV25DRAFT_1840988 [Artomyces pyxidatus]|uniref:Uncharacterized protein n=1 Tax=Artomyces pyxidatus TaxID=48021 RepID=A0ACB8SQC5_9AGAM|nr:hypothetical protein BV25DRAFT_1840988 [Artomyces pyxidatus]
MQPPARHCKLEVLFRPGVGCQLNDPPKAPCASFHLGFSQVIRALPLPEMKSRCSRFAVSSDLAPSEDFARALRCTEEDPTVARAREPNHSISPSSQVAARSSTLQGSCLPFTSVICGVDAELTLHIDAVKFATFVLHICLSMRHGGSISNFFNTLECSTPHAGIHMIYVHLLFTTAVIKGASSHARQEATAPAIRVISLPGRSLVVLPIRSLSATPDTVFVFCAYSPASLPTLPPEAAKYLEAVDSEYSTVTIDSSDRAGHAVWCHLIVVLLNHFKLAYGPTIHTELEISSCIGPLRLCCNDGLIYLVQITVLWTRLRTCTYAVHPAIYGAETCLLSINLLACCGVSFSETSHSSESENRTLYATVGACPDASSQTQEDTSARRAHVHDIMSGRSRLGVPGSLAADRDSNAAFRARHLNSPLSATKAHPRPISQDVWVRSAYAGAAATASATCPAFLTPLDKEAYVRLDDGECGARIEEPCLLHDCKGADDALGLCFGIDGAVALRYSISSTCQYWADLLLLHLVRVGVCRLASSCFTTHVAPASLPNQVEVKAPQRLDIVVIATAAVGVWLRLAQELLNNSGTYRERLIRKTECSRFWTYEGTDWLCAGSQLSSREPETVGRRCTIRADADAQGALKIKLKSQMNAAHPRQIGHMLTQLLLRRSRPTVPLL